MWYLCTMLLFTVICLQSGNCDCLVLLLHKTYDQNDTCLLTFFVNVYVYFTRFLWLELSLKDVLSTPADPRICIYDDID